MTGAEISFESVWQRELLYVVLLAAGLGLVGGIAKVSRGVADDKPSAQQVIGCLTVGAIAATAAFYILEPATPLKFVSACLISGYMGPALLDALEARFKLFVAESKVARLADIGTRALDVAESAVTTTPPAQATLPGELASPDLTTTIAALRAELVAVEQPPRR
jgi:hypothetical protein